MGIPVSYSHRHYLENKDPGAAGKAQKIFDSIEFSDLSVETREIGHCPLVSLEVGISDR
jgi:hypothetical protein